VFTAGATESINLALHGARGAMVTTAIEHDAVLQFAKNRPNSQILPVDEHGLPDLQKLKNALTDDVEIVSVGYVNNEIGTVQHLREIAEIVRQIRDDRQARNVKTPLLFHTDASQAAGFLDLNVARLGVDLMTLNAAKCYGPKQVGLLFVRAGVRLKPLFAGGGQESGLRSGTENVAGAIGFAEALRIADKKRGAETKRLFELRDNLANFLQNEFSDVKINSGGKHTSPAILNFSLPNLDGERAVFALDEKGVMVATGSACAANSGVRSHVLTAIGLPDELADGSLRLSFGRGTTAEQIEELKPILVDVLREQLTFGSQK
jgi:cysteine desulfurase